MTWLNEWSGWVNECNESKRNEWIVLLAILIPTITSARDKFSSQGCRQISPKTCLGSCARVIFYFEDLLGFGNVCNIFHNVGSKGEERRLEFHTGDEISAYNSLYLVSFALGWFDLYSSRCFQFWLYVRTKPKAFIGGVHCNVIFHKHVWFWGALWVSPAVTRLTVYRRPQV